MKCPNGCGDLEPFAEVDIGVGVQKFGPYGCPVCHYVEPHSEDDLLDEYDITQAGDLDI